MNSRDRILRVLNLEEPDRIPIIEWSIDKIICKSITGNESLLDTVNYLDLNGITIKPY